VWAAVVNDLAQQRRPGMRDQTRSVRRDIYRDIAPSALHLQGEPPEQILGTSNTHRIAAQADSPAAPHRGRNCFTKDPGLTRRTSHLCPRATARSEALLCSRAACCAAHEGCGLATVGRTAATIEVGVFRVVDLAPVGQ
jgi:hypothetical protein